MFSTQNLKCITLTNCTNYGQVLWPCLVSFFELKFSLGHKRQYEACAGQVSDRIQEMFRQQPWRKHATALILGRDSVEAFHFPSAFSTKVLRSGKLPLFGKEMVSPGMALLFRFFSSRSTDYLSYQLPDVPSNFKASCGHLTNLQCLQRVMPDSSSSVYKAKLKAKNGGQNMDVIIKFGKGVEHEVRLGHTSMSKLLNKFKGF